MPELAPKERLQPSLLDRLTDEEPGTTQESRERRVLALDTMRGLCSLGHPLVKSFVDGPRGRAARECAWKSG